MALNFSNMQNGDALLADIRHLYESAFPADERRDFDLVVEILRDNGKFGIRVGTGGDSGELRSFISFWDFGNFTYIEHFAVAAAMRGQGIGHKAVDDFMSNVSSRIVLEVEPPVDVITRKRVAFYESLGFTLHASYKYIQPAYAPHLNEIELRLMTLGDFSPEELEAAALTIKREVYPSF